MAGINNNLYPPIFVQSFMPAFIYTDKCRVYFSISAYNSLDEINLNAIQVTVNNQKTNKTVLNKSKYPSGVKITGLSVDQTRMGNDKYYIEIFASDIAGGSFNLNQYYKVQVRFTSNGLTTLPTVKNIDSWLSSNLAFFSQWSTVILIRGISNPILYLKNFQSDTDTTFTLSNMTLSGYVLFENELDNQHIKSYRIRIYNTSEQLLQDSGQIYTNIYQNLNEIKYFFNYEFQTNTEYILGVQIITNNLYSWSTQKKYHFSIDEVIYSELNATVTTSVNKTDGSIKINASNDIASSVGLNIIVRRTSNKSNFKVWQDIYQTSVQPNVPLNFSWKDYTIESGVWYKYGIQKISSLGYRSNIVQAATPKMFVAEDIYLNADGKQLKIRFDPQINSYSHTVSESKTETIGSKYPFIRRNANVDYRTFSLSGTITHFMDVRQNLMSASRDDLYGNSKSLYDNYNSSNNITPYTDVTYERDFRKEIQSFLYKNNVKLFRSASQGNILVKLMDISFTPNNTLNRQIYSFTCTAVQVDEYNLENLIKYKILDFGSFSIYHTTSEVLGQVVRPSLNILYQTGQNGVKYQTFGTSDILLNILQSKYQKMSVENYLVLVESLKYLKIELTSKPYLIQINNGIPVKADSGTDAAFLGHIAKINDEYIIINKQGIYQLTDSNTEITSFSFVDANETGYISYIANIYQTENLDAIPKSYSTIDKIGQYWGYVKGGNSIYSKIATKYNQEYTSAENDIKYLFQQELQAILGVRIYAEPSTVFYIKESKDSNLQRHLINDTGILEFYDQNTNIQGLYFVGPHLQQAEDVNNIQNNEFVETNIIINDFSDVKQPIKNGVYILGTPYANKQQDSQDEEILILDDEDVSEYVSNPYKTLTSDETDVPKTHNTISVPASQLSVVTEEDGTLVLNSDMYKWITDSAYTNKINSHGLNILVNTLYQIVLDRYVDSTNRYIYYKDTWYPFTQNNDVSLTTIEGIIDYYCKILRKRF